MSMKNDPKNSWDDNRNEWHAAKILRKYDTKTDKLFQVIALIGIIFLAS